MTNEQNALISRTLAGYEVQVSPAGKWYVVTGDETKALPDYETDSTETLSTAEAICNSRAWILEVGRGVGHYWAVVNRSFYATKTITSALAHCLLQIAEGE